VLVAVPDDDVAGVATAAADGTLTLVLRSAVSASRPR
jgi:Flp pilus assembly protein CpaB